MAGHPETKPEISEASTPPEEVPEPDVDDYIHGTPLVALVISLLLSFFLVALDTSIIGTAIPKITDEFQDLDKVSWYGAAFFMTFGGGFQSTWGKVYRYFPIKTWFLIAIFFFEIGSLLCGVAPDPTTLIVGRAIAGLAGAGVSVGTFSIVGSVTPPAKRPQLNGLIGASYSLSLVMGPLIGGAFSDRVSWRWCFYINLPIGGIASAVVLFFFKTPKSASPAKATMRERLLQLDPLGAALMMGMIISLILALQYGGQTHPWRSSVVIGLLVGFVAITATFICWELYQKERAMVNPRLAAKRYVAVGSIFMFFYGGAYLVLLYYLPIYFQSIQHSSPIGSGVKMLALIIPVVIATISQGFILIQVGIVPLFWVIGGALTTVGAGLLYTLDGHTTMGKWIGYQILIGFAFGMTFLVSTSNAQIHASPEDMSQVTAIIQFSFAIGGAYLVSASQCGFNNQLLKVIAAKLPDINPALVLGTGATQIRQNFSPEQLPIILEAYEQGLNTIFAIMIAACGIATVVGLFGSWKRLAAADVKKAVGGAA